MTIQRTNPLNVARAALNPKYFLVLFRKVFRRLFGSSGSISNEENLEWIKQNCRRFETLAIELDAAIWDEAKGFEFELRQRAEAVLAEIDFELGGGGFYPMIYFLVRLLKPRIVVETGVAAGFCSSAALAALKKNGHGDLWSSDFPYFRLPNPEQYIGVVVAPELREKWQLLIDGDENNLPKIVAEVDSVDMVHYDSDKSYSGRQFALAALWPKLSRKAVIVIDDIQDNSHFHDLVLEHSDMAWLVTEFEGKYIGLLGNLRQDVS